MRNSTWLVMLVLVLTSLVCPRAGQAQIPATELDQLEKAAEAIDKSKELAPFVPTAMEVVEKMLELARVTSKDVVYDLGSGDGRIVIAAAKNHGARAVGFEIDPELVHDSQANAVKEGVDHLVEIRQQDLMTADFSKATVVTIYLHPESNLLVRPLLEEQLKPGSRVVANEFAMGDWPPDESQEVVDSQGDVFTIYLWRITERRSPHDAR